MTIRELLKMRSNEKKLSSLIFEFVDYMEEDLKSALLKEFACLFDDDKEEELIKQLEEYHPERFTSFEEDKIICIIEEVLNIVWLDYKPSRERKGFAFEHEGALFDIFISDDNKGVSITTYKKVSARKNKNFTYYTDLENFRNELLKALDDLKDKKLLLKNYNYINKELKKIFKNGDFEPQDELFYEEILLSKPGKGFSLTPKEKYVDLKIKWWEEVENENPFLRSIEIVKKYKLNYETFKEDFLKHWEA